MGLAYILPPLGTEGRREPGNRDPWFRGEALFSMERPKGSLLMLRDGWREYFMDGFEGRIIPVLEELNGRAFSKPEPRECEET
jgi:hypothetical protein